MTRSFTITTTDRVGPRRWWIVRIHPTLDQLRAAATAYHPGVDFSECEGCCHHAAWFDSNGSARYAPNGYAGLIRLADGYLTGEIVAHELVHAAVATFRMNVARDVRLGRGGGEREEQLAYIYGDLYASFQQRFPATG